LSWSLSALASESCRIPIPLKLDPSWVGFFRAVFVPSLSQALAQTRDAGERQIFADRLEEGVRRRIAASPASLENMVGIITLHKQATD
jgi:hypothetical protein